MELVQVPQNGAIFDIDKIVSMGEMAPGKHVVVMDNSDHASVLGQGDMNALIAELKRLGRLRTLEPVREQAIKVE